MGSSAAQFEGLDRDGRECRLDPAATERGGDKPAQPRVVRRIPVEEVPRL
jgi:hypothetical protein